MFNREYSRLGNDWVLEERNKLSSSQAIDSSRSTNVRIWQKDPLSNEHVRTKLLRGTVNPGPQDNHITIRMPEMEPVYPDKKGNFVGCVPGTAEFDAVHTFSVIRMTCALYEHDHLFNEPFQWNTGGNHEPITVLPWEYATTQINAHYCREKKQLVFLYTPSQRDHTKRVYACRSFDCVAHETGHAILDQLKPTWHSNELPPQTGALHESFGDLTAIFLELSQIDQVRKLISQTKGDLKNKNFIAKFAEDLGAEFGRPSGLRNANNNLKLSEVDSEVHNLSQVFTGAIYDILAKLFDFEKKRFALKGYPQLLFDLAADLRIRLLQAIKAAPDYNASFAHVAQKFIEISLSQHQTIMRDQFKIREILGITAAVEIELDDDGDIQMRDNCCQTMKRMSERENDAKKLRRRRLHLERRQKSCCEDCTII